MKPTELVIRSNVRELEGIQETEKFQQLVANIKVRMENGQPPLEEPVVYYLDDGIKVIKHGHMRTLAAIEAGAKNIMTYKTSRPKAEYLELDQIVANELRTALNPIDIARGLAKTLRESGDKMTHGQLAALCGRPDGWISQHLKLLELEEPLRDAVESGVLGFRAAYAASAISPKDQVAHAEQIIAAKTVRGVKQVRRSIEAIKAIENPQVKQLVDVGDEETIEMETKPGEDVLRIARMFEAARDFIVRAMSEAKELEIDTTEFEKRIQEVLNDK